MKALIVVAHPDAGSLTHQLAHEVGRGLGEYELADLAVEAFVPSYGARDLSVHREGAAPPADILREQARIDRNDTLVLVYPVYWWSMPALLKGWIDRVFVRGWAIDYEGQQVTKKLRHLRVQLIAVAGASEGTYTRHRYDDAMKVQIEHGIFDYCGARVEHSLFLYDSEGSDPKSLLARAHALGATLKGSNDARSSVSSGPSGAVRDEPLLGGDPLG